MSIPNHLSSAEIAMFKEQFDAFDKDGDGKLTKDDTAAIMRSLGCNPTEEEILAKHTKMDADGNGTIEFPEFLAAMAPKKALNIQDDEIIQIFIMLDRDNDGFLNREELAQGLGAGEILQDDEINEILAQYDKDGDGQLCMEEFSEMMKDEIHNGLN